MDAEDVTVRRLAEDLTDTWKAFVTEHPLATPFHSLSWKRSIEMAFDFRPNYRLVFTDGEPVGALPAFNIKGLTGRNVVNPFCEYGHPLVSDGTNLMRLLSHLTSTSDWKDTLIVKDGDWTGTVGYNPVGFGGVQTGITHRLGLTAEYTTIRSHTFDNTLRRNIRRAREHGLSVRRSTDIDAYYDLHLQTMRRRGSPQFPKSFFEALLSQFGDKASLLIVETEDGPIAGLLSFEGDTARYLWSNSSKADYWTYRPNDLVYAESVRRACEGGCEVVDFGRTEQNSGVDRFKSRFGGSSSPLTSLVYPPHRRSQASLSRYRMFAPIFERLAALITHPSIGPRIKRWIHE